MPSKPTGRPRGRPAGARNRRTEAVEQYAREAAAAIEAALPEAFQGDAHAFLMTVYKDPSHDMAMRIDAAKAAVKFEKPALSSVEARVETILHDLSEPELDRRLHAAAVAAGVAETPTEH